MFNVCGPASNGVILGRLLAKLNNLPRCAETTRAVLTIVVTKLYISSALVSAMYGRSQELGLYLWGNWPLPPEGGGCIPQQAVNPIIRSPQHQVHPPLGALYTAEGGPGAVDSRTPKRWEPLHDFPKVSNLHLCITGQYCGRLSTRSFRVLGIRYFLPKRFCFIFTNHLSQHLWCVYTQHMTGRRGWCQKYLIPNTLIWRTKSIECLEAWRMRWIRWGWCQKYLIPNPLN